MLLNARICAQIRPFSSARLASFDWNHNSQKWNYTYSVISPDESMGTKGTVVMFPSCTLLSSKEEWRPAAEYLADVGYRSVLIDWPGWHNRNEPLNWSIEDDVNGKTLVSTFTEFAYTALSHISESEMGDGTHMHVCAAGGPAAVHIRRAIHELENDKIRFNSLICFSPSWRFYLTRYVPEGYPRKLARRRMILDMLMSSFFVRSKTMYRIYKSKFGLAKLTRRFYDEKIQHNPELLQAKKDVLMRDRPLSIDAAMISGYFDPVSSTPEFLQELLAVAPSNLEDHHDDSDDDDSLLNIKVPNWVKSESSNVTSDSDPVRSNISVHLVFPQDVSGADKTELSTVRLWAEKTPNVSVSDIPGKLFCHEENPALTATLIQQFLSSR